MKARYYFSDMDEESCYELSVIYEQMGEQGYDELTVFPAKMLIGHGVYWCSYFFEVGEVGLGCGKECEEYKPRNGKNGRCRYSNNCYEPITNKPITIKYKQEEL